MFESHREYFVADMEDHMSERVHRCLYIQHYELIEQCEIFFHFVGKNNGKDCLSCTFCTDGYLNGIFNGSRSEETKRTLNNPAVARREAIKRRTRNN